MIEQSLVAIVGPLLGGRFFPDSAPFDTPRPWGTYTQVGGEEPSYIDKTPVGLRNARMQINLWCASRGQASVLAKQVRDALVAAADMDVTPQGAFQATGDAELGLYGTVQDFSCWKHE